MTGPERSLAQIIRRHRPETIGHNRIFSAFGNPTYTLSTFFSSSRSHRLPGMDCRRWSSCRIHHLSHDHAAVKPPIPTTHPIHSANRTVLTFDDGPCNAPALSTWKIPVLRIKGYRQAYVSSDASLSLARGLYFGRTIVEVMAGMSLIGRRTTRRLRWSGEIKGLYPIRYGS